MRLRMSSVSTMCNSWSLSLEMFSTTDRTASMWCKVVSFFNVHSSVCRFKALIFLSAVLRQENSKAQKSGWGKNLRPNWVKRGKKKNGERKPPNHGKEKDGQNDWCHLNARTAKLLLAEETPPPSLQTGISGSKGRTEQQDIKTPESSRF